MDSQELSEKLLGIPNLKTVVAPLLSTLLQYMLHSWSSTKLCIKKEQFYRLLFNSYTIKYSHTNHESNMHTTTFSYHPFHIYSSISLYISLLWESVYIVLNSFGCTFIILSFIIFVISFYLTLVLSFHM